MTLSEGKNSNQLMLAVGASLDDDRSSAVTLTSVRAASADTAVRRDSVAKTIPANEQP